jgi:hypothetical protein
MANLVVELTKNLANSEGHKGRKVKRDWGQQEIAVGGRWLNVKWALYGWTEDDFHLLALIRPPYRY